MNHNNLHQQQAQALRTQALRNTQRKLKDDPALKNILFLVNQVFEIETKAEKLEKNSIHRNIQKLKEYFESDICPTCSIRYENPIGQDYDQTRTDLEANISGESVEHLVVIDVVKPLVRLEDKTTTTTSIIQKGIVIVKSKDELETKSEEEKT